MKRMAMLRLAGALGVAACTTDSTTAPVQEKAADAVTASVSLNVVEGGSLDFSADLETIAEQVIPGFTDAAAAETLTAHLTTLTGMLSSGDRTGAAAELALARRDLAPSASNQTDLGYIEMVFANIDAALAR